MSTHVRAHAAPHPHRQVFSITMSMLLIAAFFAATLAVNGGPARVSAQSESGLADVVPDSSVLFAEMDLDQSSDQWIKVYELLDRAGLSGLAEDELDASPEMVGQVAESMEVTGRAAMVFTSAEGLTASTVDDFASEATSMTADPISSVATSDVPEGFAVVFQPDNPDALYQQFQNVVSDDANENEAVVETTTYNGTEIEFWTSIDEMSDPSATAQIGDTVVLAVRPADIEPIIDTIAGDLAALSTSDSFMQVRGEFGAESILFGYMDGTVIIDQAVAEEPALAEFTDEIDAHMGMNAYADDSGFRMDTVTVYAGDKDHEPVASFDPTLATKMPADVLYFINGNDLAGSGVFDAFGLLLQMGLSDTGDPSMTPVATPTVDDVYAQLEAQLGFNLKTDLFDQMTGEFGLSMNVEQIFSEQPVIDAVFVSDVADSQTVTDVSSKFTYIINSLVDEDAVVSDREVAGSSISSVAMAPEDSAGFPITIEWGVIDGQFLVGVNNGIDSYVDGATATLADSSTYQQTMDALPQDNIVGVQFLSLEHLLPLIEEAATSLSAATMMLDNDEACGDYATQAEAQAAYDDDPEGLWNLDLNDDGQACEDYFDSAASVEASPESVTESLNLLSIGTVAHTDGDIYRTNTVILIGE